MKVIDSNGIEREIVQVVTEDEWRALYASSHNLDQERPEHAEHINRQIKRHINERGYAPWMRPDPQLDMFFAEPGER